MMILGYRSTDAVITVCQNNRDKSIEIRELNKPAEDMLGYKSSELARKHLHDILPSRIADMLKEYVEFETEANDVGHVLAKVQSFSVVGKDGKETGYRLKVVRAESTGERMFFRLVLQDTTGLRKNEALRKAIQDNFKGHESLDPATGLPDLASLQKDIELMGYYHNKSELKSCFAILQLDRYEELSKKYGQPVSQGMVKHIATLCRNSLRPDDMVGSVSYMRVGILLMDTTPESARMVFNRLRWQIAANPYVLPDKTSVGVSVSISFSSISGSGGDKTIIESCGDALNAMGPAAVNALTEV